MQVLNDILAAPNNGFLGCNCAVGLNTELERGEQRVGNFISGEDDVVVLKEALGKKVAKCVVFLVECEDGGIGHACSMLLADAIQGQRAGLRVSSLYSTFCWPSSRRKSSNLHSASSDINLIKP